MGEITDVMLSPKHTAPASVQSRIQRWPLQGKTQRQLYTLISFFTWIISRLSKRRLNNNSTQRACSYTILLNSMCVTAREQIYRPRVTQIRLTESITHQRANRLRTASHFSSCHVKRLNTLHMNSLL